MSGRVVRVITRLNRGGPLRQLCALVPALAERGWTGPVLVGHTEGHEPDGVADLAATGAEVIRVPGLGRGLSPGADGRALRRILRHLRARRPDVVHTHMAKAGALGRSAAWLARVPAVHTFHGHHLQAPWPRDRLACWAERALSPLTAAAICLTDRQRRDLCEVHRPVPRSKVAVVGPGLDVAAVRARATPEAVAAIRERWHPPDQPLYLWAGRFVDVKDPLMLVRAVAASRRRFRIVMLGEGPLRDTVRAWIAAEGLGDTLAVPGAVPELAPWLAAADAVVLSSRSEGAPLVVLEAKVLGRPAIVDRGRGGAGPRAARRRRVVGASGLGARTRAGTRRPGGGSGSAPALGYGGGRRRRGPIRSGTPGGRHDPHLRARVRKRSSIPRMSAPKDSDRPHPLHDPSLKAPGSARARLAPWLKKRLPRQDTVDQVRGLMQEGNLHTVCQSARCPNLNECWSRKAATFMIMGDICTRTCRFCTVPKGKPLPLDTAEPQEVADAAARLGLNHVVVTSVDRDDLPDQGAGHFASTIRAIRAAMPSAVIEVLTPDFRGEADLIDVVTDAEPTIFNHNLETVPRLYRRVRPGAGYERSLELLARVKERRPEQFTKSGLMLGLGEEEAELDQVLQDLRKHGVDILTLGQYLRPSLAQLPVERFVPPQEFDAWGARGRELGFLSVASGPFVRSSYNAAEVYEAVGRTERSGKSVSESASPSLVTLLTDFGPGSVYVGQMHAVLRGRIPDLRIVDLAHDCPAGRHRGGCLHPEALVRALSSGFRARRGGGSGRGDGPGHPGGDGARPLLRRAGQRGALGSSRGRRGPGGSKPGVDGGARVPHVPRPGHHGAGGRVSARRTTPGRRRAGGRADARCGRTDREP